MTPSRTVSTTLPPLRLAVHVELSVARAFELFVDEIDSWWPLASHSVARGEATTCAFEPGIGGRLFERSASGEEHTWGRVEVWEPPRRIAFSWHPGRAEESAQRVEVRFRESGEGTEVELVHTGWERLGDRGAAVRAEYGPGWAFVLGERFVGAAARLGATGGRAREGA